MIFIGGIHGVGKTYLCNEIIKRYNIPGFTASELITDLKKERFSNNKLVQGIDRNQDLLITAIQNLPFTNEWFLLDGHFCLLNLEGNITRVPRSTFNKIGMHAVIILIGSVDKIVERLTLRDSVLHDFSLLEELQRQEIEYASNIAKENGIPIKIIHNTSDVTIITEYLDSLIQK